MRYRKRPVVVEAVRWTGDNYAELSDFTDANFILVDPEDRDDPSETGFSIRAGELAVGPS